MALSKIDDRGLNTPIDLLDNEKIRLGTGNDLEIYHSGSHSFIKDTGTGNLEIVSSKTAINNAANNANCATFTDGGAVELYHSGTKKFETTSDGALVTGRFTTNSDYNYLQSYSDATSTLTLKKSHSQANTIDYLQCRDSNNTLYNTIQGGGHIKLQDSVILKLGDSDDVQIYHNNWNSFIKHTGTSLGNLYIDSIDADIVLRTGDGSGSVHTAVDCKENGSVQLYYDNLKEFQTVANGVELTSDTNASGTTQTIYLTPTTTTNLTRSCSIAAVNTDGNNNNALVFKTCAADTPAERLRITQDGLVRVPDGGKFVAGDSDDLQMHHTGGHSYLSNKVGDLYLTQSVDQGNGIFLEPKPGEAGIKIFRNAQVDLFYDNQIKFSTMSNGVQLHGDSKFKHDGWRGYLDRSWSDYPGIAISPDTTYGAQGEFRMHGDSASNLGYLGGGADFALDVRTDGSFEEGSDRRRKSNIEEITGALAIVKQLTGKKFNIINREGKIDPIRGSKKQYGLIAQECKDIIPEVVHFHPDEDTPNENGWASAYGLDYGQLTPLLINAVKELSTAIDTLNTKVAALEAA